MNYLNSADLFPCTDLPLDNMSREVLRLILSEQTRSTTATLLNGIPLSKMTHEGEALENLVFFIGSDIYRQNPIILFAGEFLDDALDAQLPEFHSYRMQAYTRSITVYFGPDQIQSLKLAAVR